MGNLIIKLNLVRLMFSYYINLLCLWFWHSFHKTTLTVWRIHSWPFFSCPLCHISLTHPSQFLSKTLLGRLLRVQQLNLPMFCLPLKKQKHTTQITNKIRTRPAQYIVNISWLQYQDIQNTCRRKLLELQIAPSQGFSSILILEVATAA